MHGSLLPKYRGRAPVNWAVLQAARRETGATLHEMVAKPDAGRIVDQQAVPIGDDDRASRSSRKVTGAAERCCAARCRACSTAPRALTPQDLSQGSYFGGRKPEDGRIDWTRAAREIHDLVRAVAPPYPGAFTTLGRRRACAILRTRAGRRGACRARPALRARRRIPRGSVRRRRELLRIIDWTWTARAPRRRRIRRRTSARARRSRWENPP